MRPTFALLNLYHKSLCTKIILNNNIYFSSQISIFILNLFLVNFKYLFYVNYKSLQKLLFFIIIILVALSQIASNIQTREGTKFLTMKCDREKILKIS